MQRKCLPATWKYLQRRVGGVTTGRVAFTANQVSNNTNKFKLHSLLIFIKLEIFEITDTKNKASVLYYLLHLLILKVPVWKSGLKISKISKSTVLSSISLLIGQDLSTSWRAKLFKVFSFAEVTVLPIQRHPLLDSSISSSGSWFTRYL